MNPNSLSAMIAELEKEDNKLQNIVIDENIEKLEQKLSNYKNKGELYISIYNLAIENNKKKIIEWLLSKKVKLELLNDDGLNKACIMCSPDIVELIISNGADVNKKNRMVGTGSVESALMGGNYHVIPILIKYGYKIKDDGVSLRDAVSEKLYPAVIMLLEYGFNVDLHKPNQVFDYNTTAIAEAVRNNDVEMVQLLVKHGADVTLKDKYGERPYNIAVKNKNNELIELIKSLEPEEYHNFEEKLSLLKKYKVPKSIVDILQKEERRFNIQPYQEPKYIVFNDIINTNVVKWKGYTFIDLLSEVDNYGEEGFLVWYPKKKCLASMDYEHEEFRELGNVKDFFKEPKKMINMIFE